MVSGKKKKTGREGNNIGENFELQTSSNNENRTL